MDGYIKGKRVSVVLLLSLPLKYFQKEFVCVVCLLGVIVY